MRLWTRPPLLTYLLSIPLFHKFVVYYMYSMLRKGSLSKTNRI